MTSPSLNCFLAQVEGADLAQAEVAITAAISWGDGMLLDPTKSGPRPASHMFELSLYGVEAHGHSLQDAVNNWLVIARRERDTADHDSAQIELRGLLRRTVREVAARTGRPASHVMAEIIETAIADLRPIDRHAAERLVMAEVDAMAGRWDTAELTREKRAALADLELAEQLGRCQAPAA